MLRSKNFIAKNHSVKIRRAIAGLCFTLMAGCVLLVSSCKKSESVDDDYTSAEDVAFTESLLSNLHDVVMDVAATEEASISGTILPASALIVYTDTSYDDGDGIEYYINMHLFDTVARGGGSICNDERTRAGILYVSQSAKLSEIGCQLTVAMHDDSTAVFVGNGNFMNRFTGTLTIRRTGADQLIATTKGTAKYQWGTVVFDAEKTITIITDSGPGALGDVYDVNGKGTGTNVKGANFSWFCVSSLRKQVGGVCSRTYVSGLIEVGTSGKKDKLRLNFDPQYNMLCDRVFSVSLADGTSKTYKID